jgi:NAD(P)-dependent dehydrogenase (short-subunit alcohol dehydrogenase family)
MEITGRSFVVSGGASGLGAATVRALVAGGGYVVAVDRNQDVGASLAAELGAAARFAMADVTDEAGIQAAIDTAVSLAPLGGAIACAGIAPAARIVGREGPHELALFERVLRVNTLGTFNLMRLAAAAMTKNEPTADGERGVVVCTASVAAFDGQIGQAAYAASKGAVAAMTLPAARELAKFGIRVVTIAPGIFETPLLGAMPEEVRASLGAQVPFPPRLGKPDEFAALVQHILSNVMLNGETIRLDGAIRMAPK